jgi:archaellum biogenesis ATPase FlaH
MSSSLKLLMANKITAQDLEKEVDYLIPNFLVKNSLNLIYAKAGMGKSWLMLALCLHLLDNEKVKDCIYLDMDNGITTLKDRNIDKIVEVYEKFNYIHKSKLDDTPRKILKNLSEEANKNPSEFEDRLFIFDSIRDFTNGRDMTSDKDIIPIMSELKDIRDAGATIIFLHHTTKDDSLNQYKGSTAFRDSVDVAYYLSSKRNQNILNYSLYVDKDRLSVEDNAFELNTQTMELISENLKLAEVENEIEKKFISEAVQYLQTNNLGIKQSLIVQDLSQIASDKTARKYLHKYSGQFWLSKKVPKENNATYYYPLSFNSNENNKECESLPIVPNEPNS